MKSNRKKIDLQTIQKIELDILKHFADFCQANDLKYYLAYGTLIGAIRHKGFIPWDDDIDVVMPRPDYMKFLELTKNGLTNKYQVLSYENTPYYIYAFAKVSDTSTLLVEETIMKQGLGVYIDIFPMDGVPDNKKEIEKHDKKMKRLTWYLLMSVKDMKGRNPLVTIVKSCLCPFFRAIGFRHWLKKVVDYSMKFSWEESKEVFNATASIYLDKNRKESYGNGILVQFEDAEFLIPDNYHEVLTNYYGDYMQLPPEDKRVGHCNEVYWLNE